MTNMTLADTVAFELHEAWRRPRLQADGTYEPRWKKIKDEDFIEKVKKTEKMPAVPTLQLLFIIFHLNYIFKYLILYA